MQRLYFLTPDAQVTRTIADELGELGLERDQVHVTAHNHKQWEAMDVKTATLVQTTDTVNAAKRGALIGTPLGLIIGLIAVAILSLPGMLSNVAVIGGMAVFGAVFGVWSSTLIGVSVPDAKVKKFQDDIRRGAVLMMVDVPDGQEDEIITLIHRHHPQVEIEKVTQEERQHAEGHGH